MQRDENDRHRDDDLPPEPGDDLEDCPPPDGPVDEVVEHLDLNGHGRPKPTMLNIVEVLERDPRWAGRVRRNDFSQVVEFARTPVADGTVRSSDELEGEVGLWLGRQYRVEVPTSKVAEALRIVAARHAHHPVRDYLRDLEWDGTKRADRWLVRYLRCEDVELVHSIGRSFLVSCVARVMRPGCKVDTTLILVGRQGAFKSTALRVLAVNPDWFADTPLDLGSKDLFEQIQGRWLYELAELDAFRGREWSRIKAMLSSPRDTWRRPYGRNSVQVDRQVAFCGTTNEDAFLGDPTGSRRFWPVRTGDQADLAALRRDRDQLWAEAFAEYQRGTRWWLSRDADSDLAGASEAFRVVDPWEEPIAQWLEERSKTVGEQGVKLHVTTGDVLRNALSIQKEKWSPREQSRVCQVMKHLGWAQDRPRGGDARGRVWLPPS